MVPSRCRDCGHGPRIQRHEAVQSLEETDGCRTVLSTARRNGLFLSHNVLFENLPRMDFIDPAYRPAAPRRHAFDSFRSSFRLDVH